MAEFISDSIYSMNVRGLKDRNKRVQVFSWLKNRNANIFFLQETHSTSDTENAWKEDWGNSNMFFSHGTSNSRGVCVLFKTACNFDIKQIFQDGEGRFIILDIILNNQKITLINVYGPNNDEPTFFENIQKELDDFECESIIWGGDFNCVQDITLDKKGGRAQTHVNSQKRIQDIMGAYDLVDIWRRKNPNVFRYTWHSSSNPPVQCRLDYFLVSFNLYSQINECNISPGFKTDHSSVSINVVTTDEARGRGFWKFNTSLLHDIDYVNEIKQCINKVVTDDCIIQNMDPCTLWDFLKCHIRSKTIEYSAKISRTRKEQENLLIQRLGDLEHQYDTNPTVDIQNNIKRCRSELDILYRFKTDGCIVRSRANWVEHGERNSKYFIGLEKRNQKQKVISKLHSDNGNILTKSADILNEEKQFYQNLYTSSNPPAFEFKDIMGSNEHPKLAEDSKQLCEGLVTLDECKDALKSMANNKTPGTDGFPTEFYKFFFNDIGHILVNCFNYSFNNGSLSSDQRRGVINLIPKKDKDPTFLKNWRPISLLNTDYKIITKCIALRLKRVLPSIIHSDQTGFLKGRYIGENIRLALDVIEYVNDNDLSGMMFLIDFEKAFDKLEWSFIFKTLKQFNFGDDLIKWVKVFTIIYHPV